MTQVFCMLPFALIPKQLEWYGSVCFPYSLEQQKNPVCSESSWLYGGINICLKITLQNTLLNRVFIFYDGSVEGPVGHRRWLATGWITEAVHLNWFPSWGRGSTELGGTNRDLDINMPLEFLGAEPCSLAMTRQKGLLPEKARSDFWKTLFASICH